MNKSDIVEPESELEPAQKTKIKTEANKDKIPNQLTLFLILISNARVAQPFGPSSRTFKNQIRQRAHTAWLFTQKTHTHSHIHTYTHTHTYTYTHREASTESGSILRCCI